MKKGFLIAGIIILLVSLVQGINYLTDFRELTPEHQRVFWEYHSGHLTGTAIVFLLGIVLIIAGARKKRKKA